MAEPCSCGPEAVFDEVAALEAALREAMERRCGGVAAAAPEPTGMGFGLSLGQPAPAAHAQRFDSAVAAYGVQLKAWIDFQVDSRLQQVLPGVIDAETADLRQVIDRAEGESRAVAEAQGKVLVMFEGVSEELGRLKTLVSAVQARRDGAEGSEALARVEVLREAIEELRHAVAAREAARDQQAADAARAASAALSQSEEERAETRRSQMAALERHEALAGDVRRLREELVSLEALRREWREPLQELADWTERRLETDASRVDALEQSASTSAAARVEREKRSEARLEALRAEVAEDAGSRGQLEAGIDDLRAELEDRTAALEKRVEALHLESRLQELADWTERRLETEASRVDALEQSASAAAATRAEREKRSEARLGALSAEVAEEAGSRGKIEAGIDDLRAELEDRTAAQDKRVEVLRLESRLGTLKQQLEESQHRLAEEVLEEQQRAAAEVRAEVAAALSRESAALASLDEQLWITDQRLGQRIDELVHLHLRDRVARVERGGGCGGERPGLHGGPARAPLVSRGGQCDAPRGAAGFQTTNFDHEVHGDAAASTDIGRSPHSRGDTPLSRARTCSPVDPDACHGAFAEPITAGGALGAAAAGRWGWPRAAEPVAAPAAPEPGASEGPAAGGAAGGRGGGRGPREPCVEEALCRPPQRRERGAAPGPGGRRRPFRDAVGSAGRGGGGGVRTLLGGSALSAASRAAEAFADGFEV